LLPKPGPHRGVAPASLQGVTGSFESSSTSHKSSLPAPLAAIQSSCAPRDELVLCDRSPRACSGTDATAIILPMKLALVVVLTVLCPYTFAQSVNQKEVEAVYPDAYALYLNLHQSPELSGHETQTATKIAGRLRSLGYDVTEHVGGEGVVGIMKNGAGPTVMLRTELDALPVEEKTGLP